MGFEIQAPSDGEGGGGHQDPSPEPPWLVAGKLRTRGAPTRVASLEFHVEPLEGVQKRGHRSNS